MNKLKRNILVYACTLLILLAGCDGTLSTETNNNLINKVNIVEDRWINYEGKSENNKTMNQSQFIPVDSQNDYKLDTDAYISYFNGDEFLGTILHEDSPQEIEMIENADGIILSFNKENINGIKLVELNE